MSALAQANILEFIQSRGKVSLPEIYGQFELVGKRVVDDALLTLQERRELIRGGDARGVIYAPARARQSGDKDEMTNVTIRAKAQELMAGSPKRELHRAALCKALPKVSGKAIDGWIYQEGRAGRLERVRLGTYRDGAPPPVTTRERIETLFKEGSPRYRSEIMARLADLNLHSVSTTLSELVAEGALLAVDDLYTWPGSRITKPGVIKRGGARKPSNTTSAVYVIGAGPVMCSSSRPTEVGPIEAPTTHQEPLQVADGTEEQLMSEEPAPYSATLANQVQVGGTHYKQKPIQPWDYIAANGLGFFEGNVVKYVTRWRDKAGIDDLRKARHYLDKLIEVETGIGL